MNLLKRIWRGVVWFAHVISGYAAVKECRRVRAECARVSALGDRYLAMIQGAVDLHHVPMDNWGVFVVRGKNPDGPDLVRVVGMAA